MRPAFSSTTQAGAFAVLLLVVLALPTILGKSLLPPREQVYSVQGWLNGPYPWIRNQIFEETGDIDILFVGSSHMLMGIDTPYVQEALSKKLGRPAVVRTVSWCWAGYDGLFLVTQDVLQHRKVHQLVFYDEWTDNARNPAVISLFRYGEHSSALKGLNLQEQSFFYLSSLLGMPRNLLSLVRPNIPAELTEPRHSYIKPATQATLYGASSRLGAVAVRLGYDPGRPVESHDPFQPYQPLDPNLTHPEIHTMSSPSRAFEFSEASIPAWHLHFARLLAALSEEHGCQLVMLHIPTFPTSFPDRKDSHLLKERANWPALLSHDLALVGAPADQLFRGLEEEDLTKLYFNPGHLNQNGVEYFTRVITPALLELYERQSRH